MSVEEQVGWFSIIFTAGIRHVVQGLVNKHSVTPAVVKSQHMLATTGRRWGHCKMTAVHAGSHEAAHNRSCVAITTQHDTHLQATL